MRYKTIGLMLSLSVLSLAVQGCSALTSNTAVSVNINAETNSDIVATGTAAGAGGESQAAAAEAVVADLYKQHDAKKSPFYQTKNRALVDKYFTKQLADMIWKGAVESAGEIGALGADPLYDAQDTEIKNFAVGKA